MSVHKILAMISATAFAGVGWTRTQAAPPSVEWQSAIPGTEQGGTTPNSLRQTADGGYIIAGTLYSLVPDESIPAYGNYDCVIVRIDSQGTLVWKKTFGGTGQDEGHDAFELPDGGFLVGASSYGPISGNKEVTTEAGHIWLIRLDADGAKLWEKAITDNVGADLESMDRVGEGFILAGNSWGGPGGDKASAGYGKSDCWIVRIDANGNVLWDTTYGGSAYEAYETIRTTSNGGFIVTCISDSETSGNKTSPYYGELDYWVLRLNDRGEKIWERSFGGSSGDIPTCVIQTQDGGFLVGGQSGSGTNGNKTSPNHGDSDHWYLRLNAQGEVMWQQSLGGSNFEGFTRIIQTWDGGYVIAGDSMSLPGTGTKTSPKYPHHDVWLVRWDEAGNELWQETLGGDLGDGDAQVIQAPDGGYVIASRSGSNLSGNKTTDEKGYWLVKLRPDAVNLRVNTQANPSIQETGFQLLLSAPPSNSYAIEVSSNLAAWNPWQTNFMTNNASILLDESATHVGQRFYRVRTMAQ